MPMKICSKCGAAAGVRSFVCPSCQNPFIPKSAQQKTIEQSVDSAPVKKMIVKNIEVESDSIVANDLKRTKYLTWNNEPMAVKAVCGCLLPIRSSVVIDNDVISCRGVYIGKDMLNGYLNFNSVYSKVVINPNDMTISVWRVIAEGEPDFIVKGIVSPNNEIKKLVVVGQSNTELETDMFKQTIIEHLQRIYGVEFSVATALVNKYDADLIADAKGSLKVEEVVELIADSEKLEVLQTA
jgi:hypothetical protein